MIDKKVINDALMLAIEAHGDQRRKYTGEPYITHPIHVAKILEDSVEHTTEMLAAAILHDVVEDTKYDLNFVKDNWGEDISHMVDGLTKIVEIREHEFSSSISLLQLSSIPLQDSKAVG